MNPDSSSPPDPAAPDAMGETARQLAAEMSIIAEIGRIVSSTLKIEAVYERFAEQARKLIPFDWINVNLHHPEEGTYTITYVAGTEIPGRRVGDRHPLRGSLSEEVRRTGRGLLLQPDSEAEFRERFPDPTAAHTYRAGMRSSITVPLCFQETIIGTLNLRAQAAHAFSERHLALAERIALQIAGALAVAKLYADLAAKERSLRASRERFARLIAAVPDAVIELDARGRICLVNAGALRLSGFVSEAELLGRSILEFVAPEDRERAQENLQRIEASPLPPQEYQAVMPDGRVLFVEVNGNVLDSDDGTDFRSVQVCRDVTGRRQTEEELRRALESLEARVQERTAELAEINTALQVLLRTREEDLRRSGERLQANVNQLVRPFLQRLRGHLSDAQGIACLNIAEANLENVLAPSLQHLSAALRQLTGKEVQIAEMIRQGLDSKRIAALLGLSLATVHTHRNNIRKKLSLRRGRANLRSHLLSLLPPGREERPNTP